MMSPSANADLTGMAGDITRRSESPFAATSPDTLPRRAIADDMPFQRATKAPFNLGKGLDEDVGPFISRSMPI